MWTFISRLLEELLPVWTYLRLAARLSRLASNNQAEVDTARIEDAIAIYAALPDGMLEELAKTETSRGQSLDEKTFKFGATFATVLTFASGVLGASAQMLPDAYWRVSLAALATFAIIYSAAGGLLGLAAARNFRTFGIGAMHNASVAKAGPIQKPVLLAEALAYQERANLQRVARNEAAFMCIRNGAVFIALALIVLVIGGAFGTVKQPTPDAKIWLAIYAPSHKHWSAQS